MFQNLNYIANNALAAQKSEQTHKNKYMQISIRTTTMTNMKRQLYNARNAPWKNVESSTVKSATGYKKSSRHLQLATEEFTTRWKKQLNTNEFTNRYKEICRSLHKKITTCYKQNLSNR